MLVKALQALAAWQQGNVAQILATNFSRGGAIKLDVSVYESEPAQFVQLLAEHQATADLLKPQTTTWLDVTGILQGAVPVRTSPFFAFAAAAHRNADLPDAAAVEVLVRQLLADFQRRAHLVTKRDVIAYVQAKKQDSEWARYFQQGANGKRWQAL